MRAFDLPELELAFEAVGEGRDLELAPPELEGAGVERDFDFSELFDDRSFLLLLDFAERSRPLPELEVPPEAA